jgi:hypothetical protein
MKFIAALSLTLLSIVSFAQTPEEIVQNQFEAFNDRDIETFASAYAEDVKVYNEKGELDYEGKDILKSNYNFMFEQKPNLRVELLSRIVEGEVIVEHRDVFFADGFDIKEIVVYKVKDGKIAELRFLNRNQRGGE